MGIDFGTDSSSLADFGRDGAPHVLRNSLNQTRTPTAVDVMNDRLALGGGFAEHGFEDGDDMGRAEANGSPDRPITLNDCKRAY
ncbi:MAG: hypothetical protein AAF907_18075, partial [Planctomycetota bacterium]